MLPSGKEQIQAVVHEPNAKFIDKGVPNIKEFHICRLWLFIISRHREIMLTSREHFAGTVLNLYYHPFNPFNPYHVLKHNLFSEPWEAFAERLMGGGWSGKIPRNLSHMHNF